MGPYFIGKSLCTIWRWTFECWSIIVRPQSCENFSAQLITSATYDKTPRMVGWKCKILGENLNVFWWPRHQFQLFKRFLNIYGTYGTYETYGPEGQCFGIPTRDTILQRFIVLDTMILIFRISPALKGLFGFPALLQ